MTPTLLKNILDGASDTVGVELCEEAKRWVDRLVADNAQLTRQVTDVQKRCTELLEEKRRESSARSKLIQEAARGLRKLADKYPEPPAEGECGDMNRTFYEMLANELEKRS